MMKHSIKKKAFGRTEVFFLLFTVAVLVVWAILQKKNSGTTLSAQKDSFVVTVERQPGAPLTFSSIVDESTNPREPKVTYFVANSSGRAVSAYAIRYVVSVDKTPSESSELHYGFSRDSIFEAGRVESASFEGREFQKAVESVQLGLDFVEFTDGTTWGTDTFRSSEQLAGMRAGAEAELEGLKKMRASDGVIAVQHALIDFAPAVPASQSSEWVKGFQSGMTTIRERLKRANYRGGSAELDKELNQTVYKPERRPT